MPFPERFLDLGHEETGRGEHVALLLVCPSFLMSMCSGINSNPKFPNLLSSIYNMNRMVTRLPFLFITGQISQSLILGRKY